MSKTSQLAVLAGITAMCLTGGMSVALAADMITDYPPVIEAPEPMALPDSGGWYLRGDIGYKFYNAPKASLSNPDFADGAFSDNSELTGEDMLGAGDFGVGVGYKFNDYIRADLTLDYETPAKFTGELYCPVSATGCSGGSNGGNGDNSDFGTTTESAKITAWSALANVYADLGNFNGLTPYIGAGAGASYLVTSGVTSSTGDHYSGSGQWNFAWALMAGVSYAINEQMSLDLGYRYLNLGDARSGNITDASTGSSTRIDYDNLAAHEIRVGLRYYLN